MGWSLKGIWINRYIMECKCLYTSCKVPSLSELIDTLWNVNYSYLRIAGNVRELIDTLWNVNEFWVTLEIKPFMELIDTLWNVNIFAAIIYR